MNQDHSERKALVSSLQAWGPLGVAALCLRAREAGHVSPICFWRSDVWSVWKNGGPPTVASHLFPLPLTRARWTSLDEDAST